MLILSNVQMEPLTLMKVGSMSVNVLNAQRAIIVSQKAWKKRLMFVLLGTIVQREQDTDFPMAVQWDFTENCLLQCLYRIAAFASLVTSAMSLAWQILKYVQWASFAPLVPLFLSHALVVTMATHLV